MSETKRKRSLGVRIFNVFNIIFLTILAVIFAYPYFLCIGSSFSSNSSLIRYGFNVIPREFSLEAYKIIFTNDKLPIMSSFWVSVKWTLIATVLTTIVSGMYAFPISRELFPGKKFFNIFCMFTMVFSGGTIASYLVVDKLFFHAQSMWEVVLPGVMNVWFMFLMRNYFEALPASLSEAAELDGANVMTIFFKIYVPLSKPIIATVALNAAVGMWNNYVGPLMFLDTKPSNAANFPIPLLINLIQFNTANYMPDAQGVIPTNSIQAACVIISTLPVVAIYPFLQKYFINGIMIGAVKG